MKNKIYYILILCCLLPACVAQTVPPADIYTLPLQKTTTATRLNTDRKNQHILKLAPIRATRIFNSNKMLYIDSRYTLNSYANSRWSDTPIALLRPLFQETLDEDSQFKAVTPTASFANADFLLESTLYDFSHHIETKDRSTGVIKIRFYLIDIKSKQILQTREFSATVQAPTNDAQGAATALNQAAINIGKDLVHWLDESVPNAGDSLITH